MVSQGEMDMIKEKILPVVIFLVLLAICCSTWFFTIIVDYAMLIVLGYFMTYFIFRYLIKVKFLWRLRKFYPLLFLGSVLALWIGGVLPYLNLIEPSAVYLGLVPAKILGQTGNDFMWNGLVLPLIGRTVPLELTPTYQYFWFNVVAIIFWIGIIPVMGWSCLKGFGQAMANASIFSWRLWIEWFKIILIAVAVFVFMIGLAHLLVVIYI